MTLAKSLELDRRAFLSSQQRLRRVALVSPIVPVEAMTEPGHSRWRIVISELRRLGLVEGQNIAFERYSGMSQQS